MKRTSLLAVGCLLLGCGEELLDPGVFVLTTGHEADAWERAPRPESISVHKVDEQGTRTHVATLPSDARQVSMGRGEVGWFDVAATDAEGARLLHGRSLPVEPAGLAEIEVALFLGRSGEWARPPGVLPLGSPARFATLWQGRHLVVLEEGSDGLAELHGYDFGTWMPHRSGNRLGCAAPPCAFSLLASAGAKLLALQESTAIWVDLETGESGDAAVPEGLETWQPVAGGRVVPGRAGEVYLVGATRLSEPSDVVVRLTDEGALSSARLTTARAGAAATWITDRGLLVSGGSETGPGAELLALDASAFVPLAYPPDPVRGATLLATASSGVWRFGGTLDGRAAPSAVLALDCGAECRAMEQGPTLPLERAQAFELAADSWLVVGHAVGETTAGETVAYRVDPERAEPVVLREPRAGALVLRAPTGEPLIVGGTAAAGSPVSTLELYHP